MRKTSYYQIQYLVDDFFWRDYLSFRTKKPALKTLKTWKKEGKPKRLLKITIEEVPYGTR